MNDPIIITGCARSGTSLTAGIIQLCGAYGGTLQGPHPENKRGMFENLDVRNTVIKPFLRKIGADPRVQDPLASPSRVLEQCKDVGFVRSVENRVRTIFKNQGYESGPWFIKEPKILSIWPLFHYAFPNARWIMIRRKAEDIIYACLQTSFMRAYNNTKGWQKWVNIHEIRYQELIEFGVDYMDIWPQEIVSGKLGNIRHCVTDFLGLEWNEPPVLEFITPALWSNARRKKDGQNEQS